MTQQSSPLTASNFGQILQQLNQAVQCLADYRNHYLGQVADKYDLFNEESTESWIRNGQIGQIIQEVRDLVRLKHSAMQSKFETTIGTLKQSEAMFAHSSAMEKAEFCYLNGKALNTIQPEVYTDSEIPESDTTTDLLSQANQWLTRALKFNPQSADAWCELGDTCWRQGEPIEAANHFRQALKIDPSHTEALCQLSMILRQISPNKPTPTTSTTDDSTGTNKPDPKPISPLQESLQLAHEAVKNNPTDGHAWSVLGNALITLFFTSFGSVAPPPPTTPMNKDDHPIAGSAKSSSRLIMSRCLAAYAQAAKDRCTALEPHFHYNRGLAWHYQDLFANALRCWLRAICLDPDWPAPRTCVQRSVRFLLELNKAIKQFHWDPTVDPDESSKKRQRQLVDDLIGPLGPCLLLSSVDHGKPTGAEASINGDGLSSHGQDAKPLGKKDSAALARLLGPYYHPVQSSSGDSAASLWSDVQTTRKGKKANRSGRTNHPVTSLPFFQNLQFTLFSNLQIGANTDRVCCGRVVCELPSDSDLTLNLVLLDAQATPLTIRLYNIGKGLGPVKKDIIAIPHPFVEEVLVQGPLLRSSLLALSTLDPDRVEELTCKFWNSLQLTDDQPKVQTIPPDMADLRVRLIRIPLPDVLVVNGHSVGNSWTATPVLKNIFFTA